VPLATGTVEQLALERLRQLAADERLHHATSLFASSPNRPSTSTQPEP
jgi:hypothetical protein